MPEDLSRFCCQHPDCPDSGKRGQGNLTVCGHYGKTKQHRLLYCRTCKARFSERKGTPLFGACLPEAKALELIEHLADRNGVRATARLTGVNRNTVVRYSRSWAITPGDSTTSSWLFPPRTERCSSMRNGRTSTRSRSTATPTDPADDNRGDWWDHTAYDPEHRLVLCVVPGARAPRRRRPWSPTSRSGRRAGP